MGQHPKWKWYRCELESGDPAIRFPADSAQDAADRVGRIMGEEVVSVVSLDLDPMPRLIAAGYREKAPL